MLTNTNISLQAAVERLKANDGKLPHEAAVKLRKELEAHLEKGISDAHEVSVELGSFLQQTPTDAFETPVDRQELHKFAADHYGQYESRRGFISRFLDDHVRDRDGDGVKDGKKRPFGL